MTSASAGGRTSCLISSKDRSTSRLSAEYTLFIDPKGYKDPNPAEIRLAVNYATKVKPLIGTIIPTYLCPTDLTPLNHPKSGAGRTNYAACHGTANDAAVTPSQANGIFPRRRQYKRIADVIDGTSNTILVGELRGWDPINGFKDSATPGVDFGSNNRYFPTWVGSVDLDDDWDAHMRLGGDGSVDLGGAGVGPRPINSVDPSYTDVRGQCYGSLHPGGANFCVADGSVRFITESINLTVYQGLCTRADGSVVTFP